LPAQVGIRHTFQVTFKLHPKADERKRSAFKLIKLLLAENSPEILSEHRRELLDALLWKITEAEAAKYKTRFQSQSALDQPTKGGLRHEHVFQKEKMLDLLIAAKPQEIDGILKNAIGCTVTVDEHARLHAFDREYGWERYRKAGITVIDTQTWERVT
jgi:hypothetical protein